MAKEVLGREEDEEHGANKRHALPPPPFSLGEKGEGGGQKGEGCWRGRRRRMIMATPNVILLLPLLFSLGEDGWPEER
mgnify:CR=1 FL=1